MAAAHETDSAVSQPHPAALCLQTVLESSTGVSRLLACLLGVREVLRLQLLSAGLRRACTARSGAMLRHAARCGVDPGIRVGFWLVAAQAARVRLEAAATRGGRWREPFSRWSAAELQEAFAAAERAGHATGVAGEVGRDVGRTFPRHPLFKDDGGGVDARTRSGGAVGRAALYAVLLEFVRLCPDVGYCQGMNFVAAALLALDSRTDARGRVRLRRRTPWRATWLLVAMARRFGMAQLWGPDLPRLHVVSYQFSELLKRHLPGLSAHLAHIGLGMEVLAAQWLLPLFASLLPFRTLARVYDVFFVDGWCVPPLHAHPRFPCTPRGGR